MNSTSNPPLIEIVKNASLETYQFLPVADRFAPLKRINLIVGPNNSGKSRLLRSCLQITQQGYVPFLKETEECWSYYHQLQKLLSQVDRSGVSDLMPLISYAQTCLASWRIPIRPSQHEKQQVERVAQRIPHRPQLNTVGQQIHYELVRLYRLLLQLNFSSITFTRIYVPTLRSFWCPEGNESVFDGLVRGTYFSTSDQHPLIETGANMYSELKKHLLGDHGKRRRIRQFEEFISANFVEGVEFSLIPREEDKQIFIR
jgi:energy-coupling factor transporter ATP-binding protein EcfA2